MTYSASHWLRVGEETRRMVAEVPLYADRPSPPVDPRDIDRWLRQVPPVGKRDLRRGFPKSLVRQHQDLHAAMRDEQVTLLATSGTTADRLQVIWEWSWWDPQEREAMRLNALIAKAMGRGDYREAVLTTPACGAGTCHFGSQTAEERKIDGILFFNEGADPTHWTERDCERMLNEWCEFAPRGIEADPAYLAIIARAALRRGTPVPPPAFITLTYETTTRAMRRDIGRAFAAPMFQLYGATEAGVLFMECEHGRLHPNERHGHVDLVPLPGPNRLARVLVTTLGRAWMPLLRYDIGDVVRVAESRDCACGLHSDGPLLERVEGRQSDCAEVGGATVTPLMLDDAIHSALGPAATIEQWQLVGDTLLVVDPAPRAHAVAAAAAAAAAVGALLGQSIRGEAVGAIAPEASGKYRLVKR
jgi:phenylacetate-coenzyme A ligase PaaK-like adenylate-forming protein